MTSPATLHPALKGARAYIFDAGGTIVHPDWPRLSAIAAETCGQVFEPGEMARAFAAMLRAVGHEMQCEGYVLADDLKRPHWLTRSLPS